MTRAFSLLRVQDPAYKTASIKGPFGVFFVLLSTKAVNLAAQYNSMARILIIDDERSVRSSLRETLEFEDYEVDEAVDGAEGWEKIQQGNYDLVFCDIKMPRMDGMEVLALIQKHQVELPVLMISGHGTIENAIEATRLGAFDFISKPPDLNRLLITVRNALEKKHLVIEAKVLKQKVYKTQDIIGESAGIQQIKDNIDRVAPTDARILITGENGTGKELVARWIHEKSLRSKGPLIEVNCAAIPSELIESELFGHEKGAFTSAIKQRIGKFEQANGGTLFLDEIGDMPLAAQAKVLRALQENRITRVGGEKDIPVNVRIVAATNKDLVKEIDQNNFRLDLYHRLSVIIIHVPSLNARKEDIPAIAKQFIKNICEDYNVPVKQFSAEALALLQEYNWTGNIRELRNVIERLVILGDANITADNVLNYTFPLGIGNQTKAASLEPNVMPPDAQQEAFDLDAFDDFQSFKDYTEKVFIERKLRQYAWNVAKTAEVIGIQRSHLYNKIDKYQLKRDDN
jgi:two-component system, NtrC family, nitrogen regulation response regulator NtrX